MSVTTILSPSAISVVSEGRTLSCLSTSKPADLSTSATVSAVILRFFSCLAPSLRWTTFGVTTSRVKPLRPIEEPRLADRSAPSKRRPISPSALATLVEFTQ